MKGSTESQRTGTATPRSRRDKTGTTLGATSRSRRPTGFLSTLYLTASLVVSGCQPSQSAGAPADEPRPGWEWTDEEVMETVQAVRAGRSLQPDQWPDGARVAVMLSFDVDNETVTGLRYGDATVGSLSQGQYGARVALPRIVDLLDRHDVPASFFVPAVSLMVSPDQVAVIQSAGHHEFAIHGWIHEMNSRLDRETEFRLLQRAIDYMTEVTGTRPVGYRAPSWNFSPHTLEIIRELGFLYDSSLMADDRAYEINAAGEPTGMVELPVEWIMDDAPLLPPLGNRYSSPRDLLQVWKDDFDQAYAEGTQFLLTMHPHVIGQRSRIVILDELISYIKSHDDVWFATHRDVAAYVKEEAGL